MYLQVLGVLRNGLLQEERHQQEVQLGHIGVLGEKGLENGEPWEMAGLPVDFAERGPAACVPAHVET